MAMQNADKRTACQERQARQRAYHVEQLLDKLDEGIKHLPQVKLWLEDLKRHVEALR